MLTTLQKQQKREIQEAFKQMLSAKQHYNRLVSECNHIANLTSPDEDTECIICNTYLGWKCPNSPDHVCHYDMVKMDNHEGVFLIDHTFHPLTDLQISEYNDYDEICVFCNNPNERK